MLNTLISWDQSLFNVMNSWAGQGAVFDYIIRIFALWPVYFAALFFVYLWFSKRKLIALEAVFSGLVAWLIIAKAIAQLVPRARPEEAMMAAKEIFFHRPTLSFPSDHASFMFAIAFTFYFIGQKKFGHLFLILAILMGAARVIAGIHFPADILAGAAVGLFVAYSLYCIRDFLTKHLFQPLIDFAKKFRL